MGAGFLASLLSLSLGAASPAAAWSFDDASAPPFLDSVGNLSATANTTVPRAAGVVGQAIGPDGPTVRASLPNGVFGGGNFTIELWLKPNTGTTGTIWSIVDTNNGNALVSLAQNADGTVQWAGGGDTVRTSAALIPASWNHVVVIYDNLGLAPAVLDSRRSIEIWINGFLYGLDDWSTPATLNLPASVELDLRPGPGGIGTWDGLMDTLQIYATRLAEAEILAQSGPENPLTANFFVRAYNGLNVPTQWPPRMRFGDFFLNTDVYTPWYVLASPAAINIDTGRQLFVDDFLIASTTLAREYHHAMDYPGNPILTYDKPWEQNGIGGGAWAAPYSDGVWYDPERGCLRMWYQSGTTRFTALAESDNGLTWRKPDWGVVPQSNIVMPAPATPATFAQMLDANTLPIDRNSNTVWLNSAGTDPARRYVMLKTLVVQTSANAYGQAGLRLYFSPDGVHWSEGPMVDPGRFPNDRSTLFFNPFRQEWVFSIRYMREANNRTPSALGAGGYRARAYYARPLNDLDAPFWDPLYPQFYQVPLWWMCDWREISYPGISHIDPDLYNLDATPYESVMVGLFSVRRAIQNNPAGWPKITEVYLGFSRDGFHFAREPDRATAFISANRTVGSWKYGLVQSAGGGFLVTRDWLWFYYCGSIGTNEPLANLYDGGTATGLAFLRRDGFASLDADAGGGVVETKNLVFSGGFLFVNVDAPAGALEAEVCDVNGEPLPGFTRDDCESISLDATAARVYWTGGDLSGLAGQPVRFRFYLRSGKLYSFWVSPAADGRSQGYLAAGQPGQGGVDVAGANPPFSTYAQWRLWRFSPLDVGNDAVSGPAAIDSADGLTNFAHYVLLPNEAGMPSVQLRIEAASVDSWRLIWECPAGRDDVTWSIESSTNLQSWSEVTSIGVWEKQAQGDGSVRITAEVPRVAGPSPIFYRTKAG